MRTNRRTPAGRVAATILTIVPVLLATACDDGATDPDENPVDAADALRLVEFLTTSGTTWPADARPTCPLGGQVRNLRGQRPGQGPDGSDFWEVLSQVTFERCRSAVGAGVWTLEGEVVAEARYHLDAFGRVVRIDGSATGRLEWSRDRGPTPCTLDLTLALDPEADVLDIAGRACGFAVAARVPHPG